MCVTGMYRYHVLSHLLHKKLNHTTHLLRSNCWLYRNCYLLNTKQLVWKFPFPPFKVAFRSLSWNWNRCIESGFVFFSKCIQMTTFTRLWNTIFQISAGCLKSPAYKAISERKIPTHTCTAKCHGFSSSTDFFGVCLVLRLLHAHAHHIIVGTILPLII